MGNGQFKEFASAARYYVDPVDINEFPLHRVSHCFELESSDVCGMDSGIRASS